MKKLKRPSIAQSVFELTLKVKAKQPVPILKRKRDYVYITYHDPMPESERKLNSMLGSMMGTKGIKQNWYGSFSSGRCGIISYWHWDTREPYYLDLYRKLQGAFQTSTDNRRAWAYHYPELEIDRGNGNLGSKSIAFNATYKNVTLVESILEELGLDIQEK